MPAMAFLSALTFLSCLLLAPSLRLCSSQDAMAAAAYSYYAPKPHHRSHPVHKKSHEHSPYPITKNPLHLSPYGRRPPHNVHPNPHPMPSSNGWLPATATWYGSATGAGSDGGACGYGNLARSPYGNHVSAGSPPLFKGGQGCGTCYQVKCLAGSVCSQTPVTVVITDECPGGYCAFGRTHFDMSGSAFSAMSSSSQSTQSLLNAGVMQVLYKRVPCSYPRGTMLSFQVNEGATNYWFSMLVRYEGGDGDLSAVELMEAGHAGLWKQMEHLWGAYWCLNAGPLRPPFSIKITSSSGASLTALNVIPPNYVPGGTYSSHVNF